MFNLFSHIIIFHCLYTNSLGHPDNYIPANPDLTPEHIVPEWYFLPFYAILRSIPNKLLGVIALLMSIIALLLLPFLDDHKSVVRSLNPYCILKLMFYCNCVILGYMVKVL